MSIATFSQAPAGWYADPRVTNTVRYWDGVRWTGNVVPLPKAGMTRGTTALVVAGYLSALVVPLLGFVIGVVLLATSPRRGAGVGVLVAAGLSFALYVALYLLAHGQA